MKVDSFLPELSMHLSRPSVEKLLDSLTEGDILQGQVQKQVDSETWVVRVSGQDIVARSSTSLVEGRSITARVDSMGPPVLLSLVEEGEITDPEQALGRALGQAGVRNDSVSRSIVQRMMENGLPVSAAEVEVVRRALLRLKIRDGEGMEKAIDHILKLRLRSMPVTAESMSRMLPEQAGTAIGKTVEGILRELLDSFGDDPDILDLLERMADIFVPSDRVEAQALSRAVADGGLHLEPKLARLLATGGGLKELGDDLKGLLARLAALVEGRLADVSSGEGRLENTGVLARITGALRLIEAFQITGLPTSRSDGSSFIYFFVPIVHDSSYESVGIKIACREEGGKRCVDSRATTIGLELDLVALGRVEVSLTIAGMAIDGRIDTEDSERSSHIGKAEPELQDALDRLGYHLRSLTMGLVPPLENPDREEKQRPPLGFDVRA